MTDLPTMSQSGSFYHAQKELFVSDWLTGVRYNQIKTLEG